MSMQCRQQSFSSMASYTSRSVLLPPCHTQHMMTALSRAGSLAASIASSALLHHVEEMTDAEQNNLMSSPTCTASAHVTLRAAHAARNILGSGLSAPICIHTRCMGYAKLHTKH